MIEGNIKSKENTDYNNENIINFITGRTSYKGINRDRVKKGAYSGPASWTYCKTCGVNWIIFVICEDCSVILDRTVIFILLLLLFFLFPHFSLLTRLVFILPFQIFDIWHAGRRHYLSIEGRLEEISFELTLILLKLRARSLIFVLMK